MEKQNKSRQTLVRLILIVIAIAALLAIAWCVWYLVQYYQGARHGREVQEIGVTEIPIIDPADVPEVVDPAKIVVSGQKTWDDARNQDGIRPESIMIRLLADGVHRDLSAYNELTAVQEKLFGILAEMK